MGSIQHAEIYQLKILVHGFSTENYPKIYQADDTIPIFGAWSPKAGDFRLNVLGVGQGHTSCRAPAGNSLGPWEKGSVKNFQFVSRNFSCLRSFCKDPLIQTWSVFLGIPWETLTMSNAIHKNDLLCAVHAVHIRSHKNFWRCLDIFLESSLITFVFFFSVLHFPQLLHLLHIVF